VCAGIVDYRPIRRVLVVCPVYELYARTLESLCNLRWDGALDRFLPEDNPFADGRFNITHNYIKAQRMAIAGDYDALLTFESDIVAPADGLEMLAAQIGAEVGVARGLYCSRRNGQASWFAQTAAGVSVAMQMKLEWLKELISEYWQ